MIEWGECLTVTNNRLPAWKDCGFLVNGIEQPLGGKHRRPLDQLLFVQPLERPPLGEGRNPPPVFIQLPRRTPVESEFHALLVSLLFQPRIEVRIVPRRSDDILLGMGLRQPLGGLPPANRAQELVSGLRVLQSDDIVKDHVVVVLGGQFSLGSNGLDGAFLRSTGPLDGNGPRRPLFRLMGGVHPQNLREQGLEHGVDEMPLDLSQHGLRVLGFVGGNQDADVGVSEEQLDGAGHGDD